MAAIDGRLCSLFHSVRFSNGPVIECPVTAKKDHLNTVHAGIWIPTVLTLNIPDIFT
jgi:hypothetical protein